MRAMKEVAISKLKAKCFAILEEVCITRKPIRVTRVAKPLVEIFQPSPETFEDRRVLPVPGIRVLPNR